MMSRKGEESECWRGWMLERVNGGKGVNCGIMNGREDEW